MEITLLMSKKKRTMNRLMKAMTQIRNQNNMKNKKKAVKSLKKAGKEND